MPFACSPKSNNCYQPVRVSFFLFVCFVIRPNWPQLIKIPGCHLIMLSINAFHTWPVNHNSSSPIPCFTVSLRCGRTRGSKHRYHRKYCNKTVKRCWDNKRKSLLHEGWGEDRSRSVNWIIRCTDVLNNVSNSCMMYNENAFCGL